MKMKDCKVAQAVKFEGRMHTNFHLGDNSLKDLELDWKLGNMYITSPKDMVIVTGNNIAYTSPLDVGSAKKSLQLKGSK